MLSFLYNLLSYSAHNTESARDRLNRDSRTNEMFSEIRDTNATIRREQSAETSRAIIKQVFPPIEETL